MGDVTCAYGKIRQCRIHAGRRAKENSETSSEGARASSRGLVVAGVGAWRQSWVLEATRLRRNLSDRRFPAASRSQHFPRGGILWPQALILIPPRDLPKPPAARRLSAPSVGARMARARKSWTRQR